MLEQRLGRMTITHQKLAVFGVVAGVLIFVGWDVFDGISSQAPAVEKPSSASAPTPIAPEPIIEPIDAPPRVEQNRVSYAIEVAELAGLAPTTAPGTLLEVWVTWDPPITKRPKLQKLLDDVVLDGIAPPVTPEGPHVALLLVARNQLDELLWADRYGSLSTAVTPPR